VVAIRKTSAADALTCPPPEGDAAHSK
jgi:hypothetical protein